MHPNPKIPSRVILATACLGAAMVGCGTAPKTLSPKLSPNSKYRFTEVMTITGVRNSKTLVNADETRKGIEVFTQTGPETLEDAETVEDINYNATGNMADIFEKSKAKYLGKTIKVTSDKHGNLLKKDQEDNIQINLPDRVLRQGDTWSGTLQFQGKTFPVNFRLSGFDEVNGDLCARVAFDSDTKLKLKSGALASSEMNGSIFINTTTNIAVKSIETFTSERNGVVATMISKTERIKI